MCQANLFAGRMEIEVRFDRVSIMAIQKKKVAGRSKSRKTNSAWRYHKKSMMLISMILVLLVGVLAVNAVSLRSRNAQYKKQEAELEAQIKEEKKACKGSGSIRSVCEDRRLRERDCRRKIRAGGSE